MATALYDLPLFRRPETPKRTPKRKPTIRERFEDFHRANPHIFHELVQVALEAKRAGYEQWSINGAFEVVRWNKQVKGEDPHSEYKLNNSYRALYARKLMTEVPALAGFFQTRQRRAA